MGPLEIVILICAIALVAFTVIYNIRKRKKGGGCAHCSGCSASSECHSFNAKNAERDIKKT